VELSTVENGLYIVPSAHTVMTSLLIAMQECKINPYLILPPCRSTMPFVMIMPRPLPPPACNERSERVQRKMRKCVKRPLDELADIRVTSLIRG
jgi:hypothetical protein